VLVEGGCETQSPACRLEDSQHAVFIAPQAVALAWQQLLVCGYVKSWAWDV
jgi:hypothetical protein